MPGPRGRCLRRVQPCLRVRDLAGEAPCADLQARASACVAGGVGLAVRRANALQLRASLAEVGEEVWCRGDDGGSLGVLEVEHSPDLSHQHGPLRRGVGKRATLGRCRRRAATPQPTAAPFAAGRATVRRLTVACLPAGYAQVARPTVARTAAIGPAPARPAAPAGPAIPRPAAVACAAEPAVSAGLDVGCGFPEPATHPPRGADGGERRLEVALGAVGERVVVRRMHGVAGMGGRHAVARAAAALLAVHEGKCLPALQIGAPPRRGEQQPARPPADTFEGEQQVRQQQDDAEQEGEDQLGGDGADQPAGPSAKRRATALAERWRDGGGGGEQQVEQAGQLGAEQVQGDEAEQQQHAERAGDDQQQAGEARERAALRAKLGLGGRRPATAGRVATGAQDVQQRGVVVDRVARGPVGGQGKEQFAVGGGVAQQRRAVRAVGRGFFFDDPADRFGGSMRAAAAAFLGGGEFQRKPV